MDEKFHKQNIAFCHAIMAGDEESKEKIIIHNNIFINRIFNRRFYWLKFTEREDYLQAGRLAILKAVKNYDENHESRAQFSTYAYKYIYFHMLNLYLKQRQDTSLNSPVGEDLTLGEIIPSCEDGFDKIFEETAESPLFDKMQPFVAQLSKLDKQIIKLKFFYSNKNYGDEELANYFHMNKTEFLDAVASACSKLKVLIENQQFIRKYLKQNP